MDSNIFIKLLTHLYPKILGAEVSYSLEKKSETEQYILVNFKTLPKIPIISSSILELALDDVEYDIRKYIGGSYENHPILTLFDTEIEDMLNKKLLIVDPKFQEASDKFALTYKDPIKYQSQRTYMGGMPVFKLYPKDVVIEFDYNGQSIDIYFHIYVGKIFYDNVELTDKLLQDFIDTTELKEEEETIDSVKSSILGVIQGDIADTWNWPVIVEQWSTQVFEPFNYGSRYSDNMYYIMFDGADNDSDHRIIRLLREYLENRGLLK